MTKPVLAKDRSGRRYSWPPTPPYEFVVPSVTTILGQLSKPALTNWAALEVASYAVKEWEQWQGLNEPEAIDHLKRAPYRKMTKRQEIGSAVHTAIDAYQGGQPIVKELELLPYVAAGISYMEEQTAGILHKEVTLFNRRYMYAGTCDLIATLTDGRTAVVDWKTGKNIYPESALQLAAYANAEFIGTEQGEEIPLPPVDLGVVVHLRDDATYLAREVTLTPRLFRTFVALRTLQVWRDDYENTALGTTAKGPAKKEDLGNVVRLRG